MAMKKLPRSNLRATLEDARIGFADAAARVDQLHTLVDMAIDAEERHHANTLHLMLDELERLNESLSMHEIALKELQLPILGDAPNTEH
jgi:hypothetical protein